MLIFNDTRVLCWATLKHLSRLCRRVTLITITVGNILVLSDAREVGIIVMSSQVTLAQISAPYRSKKMSHVKL